MNMNRVQKIFLILLSTIILALVAIPLYAEETLLQYNGSGSYIYIERTDLRRYDNGKYTGLVSREIRSFISPMGVPKGGNPRDSYYDGNFYVAEGTMRARASVGEEINNSIPSTFKITPDGQLIMIKDNGYPTFRSFPAFTRKAIKYGDRWQAKAERVVDPLNKGVKTKMPIYVEYTYLRDDIFHDEKVYVIGAQWATRYGLAATLDFGGDRDLKFAQGSHKANILVSKRTGNALVVRDTVDEEFQYTDGNRVAFKGTISMFTEYPPAYDKEKLFPALQRIASVSREELEEIMDNPVTDSNWMDAGKVADINEPAGSGKEIKGDSSAIAGTDSAKDSGKDPLSNGTNSHEGLKIASVDRRKNTKDSVFEGGQNSDKISSVPKTKVSKEVIESTVDAGTVGESKVTVENTAQGIRLTMQNLKFKADSAELLSGEDSRLNDIAELLKMVPEQMILIEGHTASVGNPKGEMQLSIERADSIKKALVKRGVGKDKIICKGSGGTKPVADNSTPSGKAKNRRVEITILD